MIRVGPEASPAFFFSPGRGFLVLLTPEPEPEPDPAMGRQTEAYSTCKRAMTGRAAHMVGTGSATRCGKLARNRPAMATGITWRAVCDAVVAWTWTGCSWEGSVGLPDAEGALEEDLEEDDMVTGSTRGMAPCGREEKGYVRCGCGWWSWVVAVVCGRSSDQLSGELPWEEQMSGVVEMRIDGLVVELENEACETRLDRVGNVSSPDKIRALGTVPHYARSVRYPTYRRWQIQVRTPVPLTPP